MKIVNVLVFLLFASLLITSTSCQKELDFGTFESTGTLKTDSAFDCLPSSVHGTYMVNNVLTDTNYIELQVNTTLSGNYLIQSDTTNGYGFKGEGSFSGTGINTIRLYATGTPTIPGTNSFIIHYNTPAGDSSFCIIDVDVIADAGANAEYTFAGAGGTCTGGGHAGTYAANVPMNSSNTDTITVDVTVLGNFSITTGTINGVTFLASGAFTTLGPQTVVLTANGTPAAQGPFDFPVSGNSPGCAFNITFDPPPPPAVFTLGTTPGNCTGAVLGGAYLATISVTGNTSTIDVNVTTAGLYNISTGTANGVTFSATGLFTTTGIQQVALVASGTATAAGPFSYTVAGGSNTCTFSITYGAAPAGIYTCNIDGVPYSFFMNAIASIDDAGTPRLYLDGFSGNLGTLGNAYELQIFIDKNAGNAVTPGAYNVDGYLLPDGYRIEIDFHADNSDGSGVTIWNTSSTLIPPPNPPFTVNVATIGVSGGTTTGTFSGTLTNTLQGSTIQRQVTNGVFNLPIQ